MDKEVFTAETSEELNEGVAVDESTTENAPEVEKPTDSESQVATEQQSAKKEQTKEENSAYARARREREQAEKIEKAKAEAIKEEREKAVIEYVKTNPYTNKPISNAQDVAQYLRMKRIDEAGGDPLQDYADEIDRENKEAEKRKEQEAEAKKRIDNDLADFRKTYPNVDLNKLLNDKAFTMMCRDKLGDTPLTELYKDYEKIVEGIRTEERQKFVVETAKKKSGVGSAEGKGKVESVTKAQFKRMSLDERTKLLNENPTLYKELKD